MDGIGRCIIIPATQKIWVVSGKRKTALAKATIKAGSGKIRINNVPLEILEPKIARDTIVEPLLIAGEEIRNKVDIKINTSGGGFMGQAEASRMALAKAILKWTKSSRLRTALLKYDRTIIAGDPRQKESKKFGGPGARARDQKSYR